MPYQEQQQLVDVNGDGIPDYAVNTSYGEGAGYAGGFGSPVPASAPPNLPPGARFQDTVRGPNGSIIDRYVVPQRGTVPVRSVVPEQQQYQVTGQVMVPETRHIQVPKQVMVPVQETVMVPQVRTKMVPRMTTETRAVTVQKPVQTVQNMVRTVNKVVEGQKIVQSHQVIEYERPKVIQGRFLGMRQAGISEVGVQWTGQYYSGGSQVAAAGPVQYVRGGTQYVTATSPSLQYAQPGYQLADGYGYAGYAPDDYYTGDQYTTNPGPYPYNDQDRGNL